MRAKSNDIAESIGMDFWSFRNRRAKSRSKILKRIYSYIYYSILERHGSFIGILAEFKDRPILPHGPIGIFISNGAKIGSNCVIFHQVTIGSNTVSDSKHKGYPTIGDNCYIGAGAKIIGNVKIGDNVRIGANCVVVEDVESNSVVVLNKPRIIKKAAMDNTYFKYGSLE
jgi:serine O-acetyltransferase